MIMSSVTDVRGALAELVGLRCEGVDNPYGSVLRLDLGPMGRRPGDSPSARPHGWRHLTILSPWRLQNSGQVVVDWNVPGGAGGRLSEAVRPVLGQEITEARAQAPGWDLIINWRGGLQLVVFSDSTEDREDAWVILGNDGLELGVGPAKAGATGYELKPPG